MMKKLFHGFLADRTQSRIQMLLILGIVIVTNVLVSRLIIRFDLTENQQYTLSQASKELAVQINDPISVKAYFSADLPPQLAMTQQEFKNFLDEFRVWSGGNLEYEFVNPNESEQTEQQAQQAQIQPLLIDVRERDQVSQKRAYLGAVFKFGDKTEVIPLIQPGAAMEYNIASTVKKLIIEAKPKIGLLTGHGEVPRAEMVQLMNELEQMYEVVDVASADTAAISPELEALLIVRPEQQLPEQALVNIDQYVMSGGKLIAALNRVGVNLQMGQAKLQDTGLERLLAAYKLPVNGDLVRDVQANTITVRQQQGPFSFLNQIRYPYIPVISSFGEHPVASGLEALSFQFVSSIDVTLADSTQKVSVLAKSSEKAGTERGYFNIDPFRQWVEADFTEKNLVLAAISEGTFTSAFATDTVVAVARTTSSPTAVVVFGDGDFVTNGPQGQQQQQQPQDNIAVLINAVDYLADDTGLISLRTKGVSARPLDVLEDGTKTTLKYLNVLLPIVLVMVYGAVRYQRRTARRRRWAEQGV
jgi:gliding-associated putative ABC transporter substrate-binding component GldG